MNIYVARQPIFDRKMNVFGYELLYRGGTDNYFGGIDDTQATSELINNAFINMQVDQLTFGSRAFINFSGELIERQIPLALPKEKVVIEVLERVDITEGVVGACKNLKQQGYVIALDDFIFDKDYLCLVELADIIKVEFNQVKLDLQKRLIQEFKGTTKFLAEKVETREEYRLARDIGYDYFQGYFFSKPILIKGSERKVLKNTLLSVANELRKSYVDYNRIARICERDIDLSYKLLRSANYVKYGMRYEIKSIKQALAVLGVEELKKWIYLMMFKDTKNNDNQELIKSSIIRGKLMELLAKETGEADRAEEYFVTGLFSFIDILLNKDMAEVVKEIPLSASIKEALLGGSGKISRTLELISDYEKANWDNLQRKGFFEVTKKRFMELYIQASKFAMEQEN